jgi:hypothetical protein
VLAGSKSFSRNFLPWFTRYGSDNLLAQLIPPPWF